MAKLKFGLVSVLVLGLVGVVVWQEQRANGLIAEASALRSQVAQTVSVREEGERLAKPQTSSAELLNQDQLRELMRLRGEVGVLRSELAEARRKQPAALLSGDGAGPTITLAALEKSTDEAGTKARFAKDWMSAFNAYAMENRGRFPTNFNEAARFLSENAKAQTNVTTDQFEIVYQGSRNDLTNAGDEETIVLRERQAWQNYDGKWGRIYGRQDGSALVRTMKDLDALEQWEKEHLRANSQP